MKPFRLILFSICLLQLSACQTLENVSGDIEEISGDRASVGAMAPMQESETLLASPCPQVEIVDDLSSLSDFTNPKEMSADSLISRVDLNSAESTCKLASTSAVVDLKVVFNGKLGPKARQKSSDKPFFSYPFFIAVTAPSGKIMAKEIFSASLSYGANQNTHAYFENLRQIIPISGKDNAKNYRILVGFQLSPDQLAYNRANMVPIASAEAAESKKVPE